MRFDGKNRAVCGERIIGLLDPCLSPANNGKSRGNGLSPTDRRRLASRKGQAPRPGLQRIFVNCEFDLAPL